MERAVPRAERHVRRWAARGVLVLLLAGLPSCRSPRLATGAEMGAASRLPAFTGDPAAFEPVTDLLFVRRADAAAWRRGLVATSRGLQPRKVPPAPGIPAEAGYRLRTAHVLLRTNAPWPQAVRVATLAEQHVRHLFDALGEDLDLGLGDRPLDVVAHATREDYRTELALALPGHHGWAAWYDDRHQRVHACLEPAAAGGLPFGADLRHEMTHQVLDRAAARIDRRGLSEGRGLWLWEGIAVWAETLGDGPGEDTRAPRRATFLRRAKQRELTPLAQVVRLPQREFLGRHYDQVGLLFDHLMADAVPGGRDALLATLRDMLGGTLEGDPFPERLGLGYAALERHWLNAVLAPR